MKHSLLRLSLLTLLLALKTAVFADVGDDFIHNGIRYIIFVNDDWDGNENKISGKFRLVF